jgi:ParB/RepB/Spo0J family partition protein
MGNDTQDSRPLRATLFIEIPLSQIEADPNQPRQDLGNPSETARLKASLLKVGIQQPLVVHKLEEKRFLIMDGHRRYMCIKQLGWESAWCRVHEDLRPGEHELMSFEVQNNRREWKPLDRSNAIARIKKAMNIRTNQELAVALHLSKSTISASLQLQDIAMSILQMMVKYDLSTTAQEEVVRLQPKLRKIKDLEVSEIMEILFIKVANSVIKNTRDFRRLGRVFMRAATNETILYNFLKDPDQTVSELLSLGPIQSALSLLTEKVMRALAERKELAGDLTEEELRFFSQLKDMLLQVLPVKAAA